MAGGEGKLVGIDLGTTFCAIATLDDHGLPVTLPNRDGEMLTPSAVLSEGEADACGAFTDDTTQAAVWALKEAVLKLRIGGVFSPGAKSVRVESLEPARVGNASTKVALFRLPHGAVAVAVPPPPSPPRTVIHSSSSPPGPFDSISGPRWEARRWP